MQNSIIQQRGSVSFPEFTGERVYMRPFLKEHGLPQDLRRWQPTVDAMLYGVDTDKEIYLMIDQASVKAMTTHRRPGVHIDGHWVPSKQAHKGPDNPGHRMPNRPGRSRHEMPRHLMPKGRHDRHVTKHTYDEAIILASDVTACVGYAGAWDGDVGTGGDCQHVDLSGLTPVTFESNRVYAGNVWMLHESVPVRKDCLRTVVRRNVPGWSPS